MLRNPPRQTATDTISTLNSRLASATLLEDRRAAILGLRSFAKQFPASVASDGLVHLISALHKDGGDSETIKIVLETLLMLFEPDTTSPESSDEITLWIADSFAAKQSNITALLDLLENNDFYSRLYALQILSHVSSARPDRTQESVFAAPLGVSRITSVLDDKREAVRNEALLLLVALTPTSAELQKVVAFENAFDRVFAVIETEGGLTHGSTTVQDCLSLLANLLKLNTSNQSYFREIGGVARVAKLLTAALAEEDGADGVSEWIKPQRDINVWGLLTLIQLFLARGAQGTSMNQNTFWQSGILSKILHLAFHPSFSISIRSKALESCGDIIRGNPGLQEKFGDLGVHVPAVEQPATNGHTTPAPEGKPRKTPEPPKQAFQEVNVIEALLELILEPAPVSIFDARLAACNCAKAFIEGHDGIRNHVLRRAIEGHRSGDDAIPNILTVILEPPSGRGSSDPYQQWMASVLLLHLLYDNPEAKATALKVAEGDAESGEEVVTFVQSVASNIIAGVQHVEDERSLLGLLMLLCTWLFEEPDAVNDFLGEGTNVQGLIAAVKVSSTSMPLVAGLCALLVGIVYEFSTKDSPVPRTTLHGLLTSNLGRETYVDRLTKLRENVYVRDFEVLPQTGNGALPEVFFDKTFMDFLKDNFSRLLRAIDRDPKFEVSILSNGVQKGVSRDLVDGLRAELEETKRNLEAAGNELVELRRKLEDEELEHRRTRESSTVELGRIKQINQNLHNAHDEEIENLQQEHIRDRNTLLKSHEDDLNRRLVDHSTAMDAAQRQRDQERNAAEQSRRALINQHEKALNDAETRGAQARERDEAEVKDLQQQISGLQNQLAKAEKDHLQDLHTANEEYNTKSTSLEARLKRAEERAEEANAQAKSLRGKLEEEKSGRAGVQTELDDLLVVFGDLEAKRSVDKARLKELGETVSEDEDEGEEGEDEDGDEKGDDDDDVD